MPAPVLSLRCCLVPLIKNMLQHRCNIFRTVVFCLSIDIHSDLAVFMAGKVLNCLGVYRRKDQVCDIGMPLRYNYDKPEKPRISRVFGYLARFFILFQTEKSSREVVIS